MALYAAYGSNLDPRPDGCARSALAAAGTGWLVGWRLTFGGEDVGWEGALATVVEDPTPTQVFVALYDVTDADERALDEWEGADIGLYRKIRVRVHDPRRRGGSPGSTCSTPTRAGCRRARYLGMIADAAEAAGAPDDYVRALRRRPVR